MKKIVLYVNKGNQEYEVKEFTSLKEGHEAYNKKRKEGDFEYLELALDRVDEGGRYLIIRKMYK